MTRGAVTNRLRSCFVVPPEVIYRLCPINLSIRVKLRVLSLNVNPRYL